ncbi:MAG: hypothetical protein ACRDS0_26300 [Pseudonocardiaceae bacterium]
MAWLLLGVKPYMSTAAVITFVFGFQLNATVPVGISAKPTGARLCPPADGLDADEEEDVPEVPGGEGLEHPTRTSAPAVARHTPAPRSITTIS